MSKFKSMIKSKLADKYNVNCKIAGKHVHLYKKMVDGLPIYKYIHGEKLEVDGFKITDSFSRTESFYDDILKILNKKGLFRGDRNLEYINGMIERLGAPYTEYEYDTIEEDIKFMLDEEGYTIPLVATEHKREWHKDKNDPSNTGNVRICRPAYFGYKLIKPDNKLKLVRSPLTTDINSLLNEYQYFSEKFYEMVTEVLTPYEVKDNNTKKM